MLSPKKYLEEFLHSHLEAYVDHFDESSLDIGVLVGDVHLSNLQLKCQEWEISPGVWMELAFGSIDHVHLQVPWMELRSGGITGRVENCNIVLKLRAPDYDDDQLARECICFANKLNKLDKEENKFLVSSQDSWVSRTMGSFASSFLSKLASGFCLHVDNFQCSVLLPNGTELDDIFDHADQTFVNIGMSLTALNIVQGPPPVPSSSSSTQTQAQIFSKEISLRGLDMRVGQHSIECPTSREDFEGLFHQLGSSDMFINPLQVSITVRGENTELRSSLLNGKTRVEDANEEETGMQTVKLVSIDIKTSNFEATPKIEQLQMLVTVAEHFQQSYSRTQFRSRFWSMHPTFTAARARPQLFSGSRATWLKPSAKELWVWAIRAVLSLNKDWRTSASGSSVPIRLRYIQSYRRLLEYTLHSAAHSDSPQSALATPLPLSYTDHAVIDEAHRICTIDDLLTYRAYVHKALRGSGFAAEDIQQSLVAASSFLTNAPTAHPKHNLDQSAVHDDQSSPPEEQEAEAGQNTSWEITLRISRLAIAILSPIQADRQGGHDSHDRAVTVLLYGLRLQRQFIYQTGESIMLSIGSVRLYGGDVEALSCGGDPDRWLQPIENEELDNSPSNETALSLTYQIIDTDNSESDTSQSDERGERLSGGPGQPPAPSSNTRICLSKLAVAKIHIHWHQVSMNFMRDLVDTISLASIPSVEEVVTRRRVEVSPTLAPTETSAPRWNLQASLEGIQFSIPNFENGQIIGTSPAASSSSRFAIIRVGQISARGGSYTQEWLDCPNSIEPNEQEDALRATVRAIQDPNVNSFIYNVDRIEILLVDDIARLSDGDIKITRVPWSLSGALSVSKYAGSEKYPNVRIDILCSKLDLLLSVGSTITLLGCANQVVQTMFSLDDNNEIKPLRAIKKDRDRGASKNYRQRLKGLVGLCKFYMGISFSASNFALTSDQPNADPSVFTYDLLTCFVEKVIQRGELSQVMDTNRRLLLVQLQKQGLKEKDVVAIIDSLLFALRQNNDSTDTIVQSAVKKILALNVNFARLRDSPIIEIHLGRSKLTLTQLTYDYKMSVDIKRLLVTGPSQIPLVHIQRSGNASSEKSNSKARAKKDSGAKGLRRSSTGRRESDTKDADESERANTSISIEYCETDAGFSYGVGDSCSLQSILDPMLKSTANAASANITAINRRDGQLKLKVESLFLLIPTDFIPVVGKMMHASNRINMYLDTLKKSRRQSTESFATHLERRSSNTQIDIQVATQSKTNLHDSRTASSAIQANDKNAFPTMDAKGNGTHKQSREKDQPPDTMATTPVTSAPPAINLYLLVDLRSIEIVLSHENNFLALVMASRVNVKLDIDLQYMSGTMSGSIASIRMHDLSEVGSLHPLVMWSKAEGTQSILEVSCVIDQKKSPSNLQRQTIVTADIMLTGMRVCLLYRFLQEILAFIEISQKMTADMIENLHRSHAVEDDDVSVEGKAAVGPIHEQEESSDTSHDSDSSSNDDRNYHRADIDDDDDESSVASSSMDSSADIYIRTPRRGPLSSTAADGQFLPAVTPSRTANPATAKPTSKLLPSDQSSSQSAASIVRTKFHLKDFVLVCPRNSSSMDLVAVTVACGTLANFTVAESWQAPKASDVEEHFERKYPLFFNPLTNTWTHKGEQRDGYSMSSFDFPLVSEPSSMETDSMYADSTIYQSANKSFAYSNRSMNAAAYGGEFGTPDSAEKDTLPKSTLTQSNPIATKISDDNNVQADITCMPVTRINVVLEGVSMYVSLSGPLINYEHTGVVVVDTGKTQDFLEVHDGSSVFFIKAKKRNAGNGVDQAAAAGNPSSGGLGGQQTWRRVTSTTFHLLAVVDYDENDRSRILVSDTDTFSTLSLNMTMAELYLLESIWFDNIFEGPLFFTRRHHSAEIHPPLDPFEWPETSDPQKKPATESSETQSKLSFDNETPTPATSETASKSGGPSSITGSKGSKDAGYGTPEYFKVLHDQKIVSEFLLVRADIKLDCFMDVDYFTIESPALKLLRAKETIEHLEKEARENVAQGKPGTMSGIKINETCQSYALPVAKVAIEGLVMHQRALADGTSQVAMGAGLAEIFDSRLPKQGIYDKVLRVGTLEHAPGEEAKRVYGFADFEYGLRMGPSHVTKAGVVPLMMSVITTESWTTTNVGLDGIELNLKNLELVWLIVDYFACYFQQPEYGHPLVAAYAKLPEHKIPHRGVDTRVFATRPHVCIMEAPLVHHSATLVLESDAGIFYRHVLDNLLSTRVEVKVLDVALIAHQRFSGHDRGLRGSAGSGTGIRTLVENLDCDYTQHYISATNHMDIQLCLLENNNVSVDNKNNGDKETGGDTTESAGTAQSSVPDKQLSHFNDYIDFEAERLVLKPVELFTPKCNNKYSDDLKKSFPDRCCHIVTSYEDVLFSVSLITDFINGRPDPVEEEEKGAGGKKGRKKGVPKDKDKQKDKDKKNAKVVEMKSGSPMTLFATVSVYDLRGIVVDNVLGLHLPLLQIFLKEFKFNFDKSNPPAEQHPAMGRRRSRSNAAEAIAPRVSIIETPPEALEEADCSSLKAYGRIHIWSDYFNNLKKCWEPLLERLIANAMYERSVQYGHGLTVRTESAIHVNISGAFFRTLNDLVRMYQSADAGSQYSKQDMFAEARGGPKVNTEAALVSTRMERRLPPVQWCPVLPEGARFGFALQNSTGQPLRFVQQKDGGKNTISFIDDGERGALNFVATTTRIRNDIIVRDAFNVQQDHHYSLGAGSETETRASQSRTKKSLCLQISGYRAISSVEADELGVKYEDLVPIDPSRKNDREQMLKLMSGRVQNALKLVAEVVSLNRGRLLHLRSVFTLRNNTSHTIEVIASVGGSHGGGPEFSDVVYTVNSGENLYVPLALLQRSALISKGNSLGLLRVRPATLRPVEDELGTEREDIEMGMVIDYSGDSVDLFETVETNAWFRAGAENERIHSIGSSATGQVLTDIAKLQLCCKIHPKLKKKGTQNDSKSLAASLHSATNIQTHSNKLPLFCYNVEIQRVGDAESQTEQAKAKLGVIQAALTGRLFHQKEDRADNKAINPVHYNIVLHPPIVLESLLPWHGHFEILHANTSRLLWSSLIEPGKAKPIHTVTLDEPLRLRIHLKYCRTGNPVLFHTPHQEHSGRTFVGTINDIQKTVEGFLVEVDGNGEDASVELADAMGQRLRINIENVEGGGGERHIVVYCPYWIVNTSQYKLRLKDENVPKDQLPAGSVTISKDGTLKDGTKPVAYGSVKQWPEEMGRETIFPGKIPPLHHSHRENGQIPNDDDLRNILLDLPFDQVVRLAYMFNYSDGHSIGKRRVCVQIDDSEWSQGFSLDSVGTPIPLSIEHTDKGLLELGYKIKVAPGRLGKYTKIVRFMPRFIIMNRLEIDFKVLQPTGFVGELLPAEVKARHFCAYHLPSVFGERSLALELEGPWSRTVFFDMEAIGSSTLRVAHKLDLGAIDHVNTRGLPNYEVTLRPEDDVGIWFETDWEEKNIVVKSFRHGSFAHEETDIQIGDVVIGYNFYNIDASDPVYSKEDDRFIKVTGRDFDAVMKLMKERETPMRLKIRTVEENIRLLRRAEHASEVVNSARGLHGSEEFPVEISLRLEIRQVEATIFIVVDAVDPDLRSEYALENFSVSHVIHYKQKGVTGNNWSSLNPGQSVSYIWEDPFKPHKLLLKAGRNVLSPKSTAQLDSDFFPGDLLNRTQGILEFIAGVAADEVTAVSLDEIGTKDREVVLPNGAEGKLYASVNIKNGATKTLIISPDRSVQPQQMLELAYCSAFLKIQHEAMSQLHSKCLVALRGSERVQARTGQSIASFVQPMLVQTLDDLKSKQGGLKDELKDALRAMPKREVQDITLSSYLPFESLWGQRMEHKHQIMVEILEAKDLRQFVIGKLEDTYCSIQLRSGTSIFHGQQQPRYTNMCEQNMSPVWIGQRFIFDVPDFDDVSTQIKARDVKIRVNVMSKTIIRPLHRFLGQADIQFSCLKTSCEEEVEGYFLLRPQAPSITAAKMIDVSGSIKLRLRWIHSDEGWLKYTLSSISSRLTELEELGRVQQKMYQLADAQNSIRPDNMLTLFQPGRKNGMIPNIQSIASGTLSLAGGWAGATLRMPGEMVGRFIRKSGVGDPDFAAGSLKENVAAAITADNFVPTKASSSGPSNETRTLVKTPTNISAGSRALLDGTKATDDKPTNVAVPRLGKTQRGISVLPRPTGLRPVAPQPDENESDQVHFRSRRSTHYEMLESLVGTKLSTSPLESEGSLWGPIRRRNRNVARVLERRAIVAKDRQHFEQRFEEECRASYAFVHTQKGRLVVTPVAAHNLPDRNRRKVSVRISYGDIEKDTLSKSNSADLSWSNEDTGGFESSGSSIPGLDSVDDAAKEDKKTLHKSFDIETLNVKGALIIQVMADGIRKKKEIARLEIPVFNLLDCLCHSATSASRPAAGVYNQSQFDDRSSVRIEDNVYEMWFAMLPTDECILGEGDVDDLAQRNSAEQLDYMSFSKGSEYKPCIQLRFRFIQREGDEALERIGKRANSFFWRLQLPSISVAVIDSINAREVLQCSVRGIDCRHAISSKYTNSSINIMWLQVDNQLPDPISPIVLAPSPTKYPEPVIRINVRKDNELSRDGLTSYEFIAVKVETFDLALEQQTVIASWALIKSWLFEQANYSPDSESNTGINNSTGGNRARRRDAQYNDLEQLGFATCKEFTQHDLYDLLPTLAPNPKTHSGTSSKSSSNVCKLYISFINIASVRINVSFIMNPKLQQAAQKVEKLQQASWSDDVDLFSSITFFLSQIGVVALDLTSSISDAPITFAEFQREKIFETDTEVEKRLRQHYLYSALTQLYKIVGSLELVGNPVGLVTSLGIGVTDFFYEPYHALITNPTDFGKLGRGVVKGTLSVVSNTTEGMIGTGTTITRSVGRIGARLVMDPTYLVAREELQRQPRTPAEAMSRPLKDIGNGVYYGVVGIVKVPYNSFRRHRALGIIPGIAKGLAGLFAKPLVGVLDAITHAGDAVRELVRAVTRDQSLPVRRLRLRNQFGPDGRLLPYSYAAALGMHVAQALDRSRLESMGNAINESVGFVTSMGKMLSIGGGKEVTVTSPKRGLGPRRFSFTTNMDSPRARSRSASFSSPGSGFETRNDLSSDSFDLQQQHERVSRNSLEFVIHTFLKKYIRGVEKKRQETYQMVIVTTARVIVADYIKKSHGAPQFTRRWECEMRYLKPPRLDKRNSGGYLLTLGSTKVVEENLVNLVKGPMAQFRAQGDAGPGSIISSSSTAHRENSDYAIESTLTEDDGSVLELYNCIAIAKMHTELEIDKLEQTKIQHGVVSYGETLECDEDGVFKIGSWEYSNAKFDHAEFVLESRNAHLTGDLECTGWSLVRDSQQGRHESMTWMDDERRVCIEAHRELLKVLAEQARENARQARLTELSLSAIGAGLNTAPSPDSTNSSGASDLGVVAVNPRLSTGSSNSASSHRDSHGYIKGGLQAAQNMLASSARSFERAVTAVQSVALSPVGHRDSKSDKNESVKEEAAGSRGSGTFTKVDPFSGATASAPSAGHGDWTPSLSPRSILVQGLSPKGGDRKKGNITFLDTETGRVDLDGRFGHAKSAAAPAGSMAPERFSAGRHSMDVAGSTSPTSLARLFSPFSPQPTPSVAPNPGTGRPSTTLQDSSSPQSLNESEAGSLATMVSELASQAGTLITQDSEAMAALHGRLDRLEQLLMLALAQPKAT